MKSLKEVNLLISVGSSCEDLKADGKIDGLKTIFAKDRINDKADSINFYFFCETANDKIADELKNKYLDEVFEIGKDTLKN